MALFCNHTLCREGLESLCSEEPELNLEAHCPAFDLERPFIVSSNIALIMMCAACNEKSLSQPKQMMESLHFYFPKSSVIVFNSTINQRQTRSLMRAGVHAVVSPQIGIESMARIIYDLMGKRGKGNSTELNTVKTSNPGVAMFDLSNKEVQILKIMASGITNYEIGQKLLLTEATVKSYLHRIFHKMDAKTRTQAVMKALKHSII